MKYPTDEWIIKLDDMYGNISITEAIEDLTCNVLLNINRNAKLQGSFKIILGGSEMLQLDISAQKVLIMGGAATYRLTMERWPRDIILDDNSTTSPWFDLEER